MIKAIMPLCYYVCNNSYRKHRHVRFLQSHTKRLKFRATSHGQPDALLEIDISFAVKQYIDRVSIVIQLHFLL